MVILPDIDSGRVVRDEFPVFRKRTPAREADKRSVFEMPRHRNIKFLTAFIEFYCKEITCSLAHRPEVFRNSD